MRIGNVRRASLAGLAILAMGLSIILVCRQGAEVGTPQADGPAGTTGSAGTTGTVSLPNAIRRARLAMGRTPTRQPAANGSVGQVVAAPAGNQAATGPGATTNSVTNTSPNPPSTFALPPRWEGS